MFVARKPFIRSTILLAASAASFILLSGGVAQERDAEGPDEREHGAPHPGEAYELEEQVGDDPRPARSDG